MPSIALPVSLRGQLLSGSRFSPLSLFTASEPGLWYDPSDLTTLFQDTVGVVPVTAPGQTVALILDKSKRLTRGSELVVNGDFSGGTTNWTAISGAGLSIVSGSLRISYSAGAAYPAATQTVSGLVSGRTYELTIVANTGSGTHPVGLNCGQFSPTVNFTTNTSLTTTTFKAIASATSTSSYVQIFLVTNSAASSGFIDIVSFSMKELAGSHATQATAASRPTYGIVPLGGRRNLLTFTEQFDNAAWSKINVLAFGSGSIPNAAIAPNGTTTADKLVPNTSSDNHPIINPVTVTGGQTYTLSVYAKGGGYNFLRLSFGGVAGSGSAFTFFDLSNGTLGSTSGMLSSGIQSAGDGWYRCSVALVAATSGELQPAIYLQSANSQFGWAGNGTDGVLLWGAQVELGSITTAYQRVETAFDVTEAGVQSLSYLFFDGVDDFLVTPTITPGTDKVQVFAGVRKLSDATRGSVIESGLGTGPDTGYFHIEAPRTGGVGHYAFRSFGATLGTFSDAFAATFNAPITNVVTGIGDIPADTSNIRVNGAAGTPGVADQGTGNYLANAIYIGRRAGTSLPFSGNMYNIVLRFGPNLDSGTIASVETFINGKTGAY